MQSSGGSATTGVQTSGSSNSSSSSSHSSSQSEDKRASGTSSGDGILAYPLSSSTSSIARQVAALDAIPTTGGGGGEGGRGDRAQKTRSMQLPGRKTAVNRYSLPLDTSEQQSNSFSGRQQRPSQPPPPRRPAMSEISSSSSHPLQSSRPPHGRKIDSAGEAWSTLAEARRVLDIVNRRAAMIVRLKLKLPKPQRVTGSSMSQIPLQSLYNSSSSSSFSHSTSGGSVTHVVDAGKVGIPSSSSLSDLPTAVGDSMSGSIMKSGSMEIGGDGGRRSGVLSSSASLALPRLISGVGGSKASHSGSTSLMAGPTKYIKVKFTFNTCLHTPESVADRCVMMYLLLIYSNLF